MIYGLTNKETGEVRYVGRTDDTLARRLNGHRSQARTERKNSRVAKWIRQLEPENVGIVELEREAKNEAAAEVWWMDYLEFLGCDLLNVVRYELPNIGPDGIDVTDEMEEMMGTVPDRKVAEEFEVSEAVIYKYRRRFGIEGWDPKIELPKECIEQLGEKPDGELAEEFEVAEMTISRRRYEGGIDPYYRHKGPGKVELPDNAKDLLGEVSDREIAERFDVTLDIVKNRRVEKGIEPAVDLSKVEIPVEELGTKPDNELAEEYDVSPRTICERRKEHGVEAYKRQNRLSDERVGEVKWLATNADMTYEEIGNRYGISDANVSNIKNEKRRADVDCVKPDWCEKQRE